MSFDKIWYLLLLMNIIINATYWISGIYTNFRRLLLHKKCDVGYYVINDGVMKLMIPASVYSFNFIITQNS